MLWKRNRRKERKKCRRERFSNETINRIGSQLLLVYAISRFFSKPRKSEFVEHLRSIIRGCNVT